MVLTFQPGEKTLKIYNVLEDLNNDILRIYAKKVLVSCQKNLVHQKIPYIARFRYLENHTEALDLYLMNCHLNKLSV